MASQHGQADPGEGLLLCLHKGAALRGEITGHLLEGILVGDARRDRMLGKPALVKLLPVSKDVRSERHADRAAGVACGVEER